MKPLEKFSRKAGQFIVLIILDSDTNNREKTLSIALSNEEEIILIKTRTGENISDFKK